MIKAAVFDFDGTLFDHINRKIHNSTVSAIKALKEKGIKIIIASGRSYGLFNCEIINLIEPDYFIGSSGHSITDRDGNVIINHTLDTEQIEQIIAITKKSSVSYMLKYPKINYVYKDYDIMFEVFNNIELEHKNFVDCTSQNKHNEELPIGITLKSKTPISQKFADGIEGVRVEVFQNPCEFEIYKKGFNKFTALSELFEIIGITADECVAFGDSGNDIEMVSKVKYGVSMGNGVEELKKVSYMICPPFWKGGIYQGLRSLSII